MYCWYHHYCKKLPGDTQKKVKHKVNLGQIKRNTSWSSWFFQNKEDEGLFIWIFFFNFQDGRQAFKFKMATNFKVKNDQQLFISSYHTSKSSQNIHSTCMHFVKPNCWCMLFSIAFSLQQNANEHHRAWFKSRKHTNVVTTTICTELTNHTIFIV